MRDIKYVVMSFRIILINVNSSIKEINTVLSWDYFAFTLVNDVVPYTTIFHLRTKEELK